MKIRIKRVDKNLPLPRYETAGAVAFDFVARTAVVVEPRAVSLIPSNVVVEVPPGYMLSVTPRSSAPRKKGLSSPHGIGIIDQDYCGPTDEIMIQVFNFTDKPVTIERGERIAQGAFVRVDTCTWEEVEEMTGSSRGGFGTTGARAHSPIDQTAEKEPLTVIKA